MIYKQQLTDIVNILNNIRNTTLQLKNSTSTPAKTATDDEKNSLGSILATNDVESILINDILPGIFDKAFPEIPVESIIESFKPLIEYISIAAKIYDAVTVSVEEQREKMETSLSAYENAKGTLSNITSELETQEQAIDDLLIKDKLSYIEEGELKELQEITKELRIQKDLADREETRTQKEVAKDTSDLFQKQFGKYDISQESIEKYQNDDRFQYLLDSDNDNISSMIADYKDLKEELDKAYESGSEEDIVEYQDLIADVKQNIFSTVQELEDQKSNISDYYNTIKDTPYDKLSTDQKGIVDSYNEISNAVELIYQQVDPDAWKSMQIESIFDTQGIEKSKEELLEMAKAGTLDEGVIQSYSNLSKTLTQNKISASEFCNELTELSKQEENVDDDILGTKSPTPLIADMKSEQTFKNLDSDLQDVAVQIVEGFDSSYVTAMSEYNPNDPYAYIRDKLIIPMSNLNDSDKDALKSNFEDLLKLDPQNISQTNQEEITKIINTIASILEKEPLIIRTILGFDTEDIQNNYKKVLKDAKRQLGGYGHDDRGFEVNNDVGNKLDAFWNENVLTEDDWILWQKVTAGITDATEAMNAYAEAKGKSTKNDEFSTPFFQQTWNSLDITEDNDLKGMKGKLLSLAGSGQLTRDTFNETEGSSAFLSMLGIKPDDTNKIDTLISQINQLKSSSEQLSSMENGISGLSENLSYREQNPGEAISSDVLAGMDSELMKQTEEWEHYESVLGNAGSSMDEVREATNKLATAYVNSNNFLANLTETEKDSYISQLQLMGVANAQEVVENRLTAQRQVAEYKAKALSIATKELADNEELYKNHAENAMYTTYENSAAFVSQAGMTDLAKTLLVDLIAQEQIFTENGLDTSFKVQELNKLALAYFGVANAIQISSAMGSDSRYWNSPDEYDKAVKNGWNDFLNKQNQMSIGDTNKNTPPKNGTNPPKQKENQPTTQEFKEDFNWLERCIKKLQSAFDKWVKQAETALTSGFINKYYKEAVSSAKSQLSTYDMSYNKYMEKANAVGLDKEYVEKVHNGTIDTETVKDKNLAEKIKEYQDWYDKAQDAIDSFRETAEKLYNIPLDKAAKKAELFSDSIDLLDKRIDNAIWSKKKNKLINSQTNKKEKTLNAYNTARTESWNSLKAAKKELLTNKNLDTDDGITAKERKRINKSAKKNKEVNLSLFTENSAGYKAAVKYNEALKARKKAVNEAKSAQQDYNRWMVEASKRKFDNVANDYNKKIQKIGYRMSAKDNEISEIETAGKKVNRSYYTSKKTNNQKILDQYLSEKDALEKKLKKIKKNTDEWYDAKDQIQEVSNSISDCVKETYELNNAINQLHFDLFDDISESINRIISEQEFLRGLFAHEKNTDSETGNFTDAGLARLGSLSASYYAAKGNADRDAAEVKELQRMLDTGKLSSSTLGITFNSIDDLQKKLDETYTKWQGDIKETYNLESAVVDAMKEKYQAELDLLQDLINAKKETLNAEKDLHDYNRTINQKTKDITTIQKQIAAYSGDTSQEGLAKLQKLQKELADRQEDLSETELDRLISDQQEMLDKLYEEYNELMTKKMDDSMALLAEGNEIARNSRDVISSFLGNITSANGYTEETKGLFDSISSSISDNVNNVINAIVDNKTDLSGTKADPSVSNNSAGNTGKNTASQKNNNKKNNNKKNNNKKNNKKKNNNKKNSSGTSQLQQKDVLSQGVFHQTPKLNTITQDSFAQSFIEWDNSDLRNHIRDRSALISAEDKLNGLNMNTMVFSANLADVITSTSPQATPSASNMNQIVNIDNITLPNVTNYDEFKHRMFRDMQHDPKYTRLINDASLNRIDGAGRLAKNNQTF